MVERTVFGRVPEGEADCTQCRRSLELPITKSRRGVDGADTIIGRFCSHECLLRSQGVPIEDDGIEHMLVELLRRGKGNGTKTAD